MRAFCHPTSPSLEGWRDREKQTRSRMLAKSVRMLTRVAIINALSCLHHIRTNLLCIPNFLLASDLLRPPLEDIVQLIAHIEQ